MLPRLIIAILATGLACTAAAAQPALSPRNANYTIEVRLDPDSKTLEGRQILEWRNIQEHPADELWFHLYWNAWRNDHSTWMRGDRLRGSSDLDGRRIREADWGWIEVDSVGLLDAGGDPVDLAPGMRFATPDGGDRTDRTVMVVALPGPVGPGETARVEMTWHAKIPRTFARTGYRGDYFFFAHWFPKLGVFEEDGWNCHEYHAGTEYFSDYGVYDVRMTVPGRYVLGATGRETERQANDDGTVTYRYQQSDVHAFSWTASPDYVVREERFEEPGLPAVDLRLLIQPEHLGQADRHMAATRAALLHYGSWYGPYPYRHVTFVDPAYGSGAGGMEYPTLFTCGTRLFNPMGGDSPESVTVHEAGHQFWYGIVGNNEFEHAWIDEGFNTFSTLRTLDVAYGDRLLVRRYLPPPGRGSGFFPVKVPGIAVDRWAGRLNRYRPDANTDDPSTPTFLYHPATGASLSYSKTALWLRTLENHLGWEEGLRPILSTFFERYKFGHPEPEDFFAVADEVSGQDLGWFFDQVFHASVSFDYAVDSVASFPAEIEGLVFEEGRPVYRKGLDEDDEDEVRLWRSEVVVRRLGEGRFPVDVLLVFEDGEQRRETWDGQSRWKLFVAERPSKLRYAAVDPDRVLMLDPDYTNNSRLRESAPRLAAGKWASKWMVWLQDLLSTFAFFV